VRDGVIYTPDLSASILPGITRSAVVQIATDLGYEVREKPLIRTDLYVADELFMTGTAAEVTPIRSVDDHEIGDPGPITRSIQETYLAAVTGKLERYAAWLEHVPKSSAVTAS
jgi:branched-chain amino acid aminotransferase